MKRLLIISIFLLGFLGIVPQSFASYQYYRAITVTSTTSVASGTNVNFPMLVSSTLVSWEPTSTGGRISNLCTAPNGGTEPCDLAFATSTAGCNAASLSFETDSYTSSTGALIDWVNVPSLSAGTSIYACYGNPAITTDQSQPSSTWNSGYVLVSHLGNGTALSANDSTADANNGTLGYNGSSTFVHPLATTTGEIDGAAAFGDGGATSTPISYGTSTSLTGIGTVTVSAWVNNFAGQAADTQAIVSKLGTGGWEFRIRQTNDAVNGGDPEWVYENSLGGAPGSWAAPSSSVVSNALNYLVATYNNGSAGNVPALYVNGVSEPVATLHPIENAPAPDTSAADAVAGDLQGGNAASDQVIDEVRVSNVIRSPSWILTEYGNQSSPNTFYALGNETSTSSFVASPAIVASAGTSTLSWSLTNASSVAITPGSFSTSAEIGSTTVNPTSTTVYTLTATASGGATSTYTAAVTVDATPPTVPGTPTVTALGTSTVSLSWSASTDSGGAGLAGYQVFRCAGSCTPSVRIGTSTLTSYADATASPNTTYAYSVTAYDGVGNVSGQSGATSVTTLPVIPITFDASSSASGDATSTFATITIGSGSNEALVVAVNSSNGSTNCQSPAVTVNGVTPTLAVAATTTNLRFESIYYLTGQSGTLSVTSTCPVATQQGMFLSSWFGVNQSNPVDATSSNATSSVLGTAVSDSITVANSGDMLVDGASARNAFVSAGLGQTVIGTSSIGAVNYGASSYIPVPAAGTYTMSWTLAPAQSWQQGIIALRTAATSSSAPPPSLEYEFNGFFQWLGNFIFQ